ncbi:MAG: hypothetical protein QXD49_08935 [Archaeoglobaceae archaeon]|nr:hypothetical protein [Archaeoglobales archaeon]
MRIEDVFLILFVFLIPATIASYVFIRISKVRYRYFPILVLIGFGIAFFGLFILFLVNFGSIHTTGSSIQVIPKEISEHPDPLIRLYGTLTILCFENTAILTIIYAIIARSPIFYRKVKN